MQVINFGHVHVVHFDEQLPKPAESVFAPSTGQVGCRKLAGEELPSLGEFRPMQRTRSADLPK